MNEELILLTGATGFLGTQVVRELLHREPRATLALLIRPRKGQTAAQRAESIVPSACLSRVQVYAGDVSQPNCGLDAATWNRLQAETTRVIHSAATVRFDHTLEEARRMNVEGTRRMLDFAAGTRHLRNFTYVGTAYVAGEREGLILESELDVGQRYRNTYEQTKAEAEALVRSRLGSLPGVILRPSIIVGDSRDRRYFQLQDDVLAAQDLRAPAVADCARVSRCDSGHRARGLRGKGRCAYLTFIEDAIGNTVHLCAGPRGSATIEQIAQRAAEYFSGPEARYVDPKLFFAAVRPLLFLTLWGRKRRVLIDGRAYRDYFTMRMQFDTANAERLLGPAGIFPPPVLDYLDRLFHYCVASEWGRKPVSAL